MTPKTLRAMADAYDGNCACCRKVLPADEHAFIDDDNGSGFAWICSNCKSVLIALKDASVLQRYLDYLRITPKDTPQATQSPTPKAIHDQAEIDKDRLAETILMG